MKATVIKAFPGVRDGEVYPHSFKEGDVVEGDLAAAAVEAGWAEVPGSKKGKAADKDASPATDQQA